MEQKGVILSSAEPLDWKEVNKPGSSHLVFNVGGWDGAATLSMLTSSILTLSIRALGIMTSSVLTLSIRALGIMPSNIKAFSITAFSM